MRAPHLHQSLRCFCLGAFRFLADEGAELPFAFDEHASPDRPRFYEYRPLVRDALDARAVRLSEREDARLALDELRREPAAAIYAGGDLFRGVLLPLLVRVAEGCGGFDWDDRAFEAAYAELETSLFRGTRPYAAVAPLVGLSARETVSLGRGLRVREAATGEFYALWPESSTLLPEGFGREPDRLCVLELERDLAREDGEPPDAPGELADAVTAIRLATAGAVACGPVLFERLDWRPLAIRPAVPIAATTPLGEPTRLDVFRGRVAAELVERLALVDADPPLGDALDRWELSLFQGEPFRSEQLRIALESLLGGNNGGWAASMRAAVLLAEAGVDADAPSPAVVRRALIETLMHGDRVGLIVALDQALLGVRERPASYYASRAAAG